MAEIGQMKSKGSTDYKCPICKDTGRVFFDKDGYSYIDDCECGLLKKQAMARRLKFADIPESFKEMTLDTFKTDIYHAYSASTEHGFRKHLNSHSGYI